MTRYDIWKTASPPEYDLECCVECNGDGQSDCCSAEYDDDIGICFECKEHCESAGCGDEGCACHNPDPLDDGDQAYDAMRDNELTGD